jgi:hypothetical protein
MHDKRVPACRGGARSVHALPSPTAVGKEEHVRRGTWADGNACENDASFALSTNYAITSKLSRMPIVHHQPNNNTEQQ